MDATQGRFSVERLSGSGGDRRKVLMIGDGRLLSEPGGPGLAMALVRRRPARAPGIDLDVLADLLPAARAIAGSESAWRLWRYDALILVVGPPGDGSAGRRLERLLLEVVAELATTSRVVVAFTAPAASGLQEQAMRTRSLDLLSRMDTAGRDVRALVAGLGEDGLLLDVPSVADAILALLNEDAAAPAPPGSARARRSAPQDEPARQHAVDRFMPLIRGATNDLQRVVLMARNSFDVPYAQVNLVSQGRLRSLAYAGRSSEDLEHTLSGMVVQQDGPLLVEDTHEDRRCDGIEETRGPDGIRFYAGYPIESLDGYRIGVLCVFDTEPHEIAPGDEVLLRDVALLAEGEINALSPAPAVAARRRPARR